MAAVKDKFINRGEGYVGVVQLAGNGDQRPIAVGPGEECWLSEEEQALTANAPRSPADNVLANGTLELVTEGVDIKHARPLRPAPKPAGEDEETGAAPEPQGDAETGSRPAGEEVGTPGALTPDEQAERQEAVQDNVAAAARTKPRSRSKTAA